MDYLIIEYGGKNLSHSEVKDTIAINLDTLRAIYPDFQVRSGKGIVFLGPEKYNVLDINSEEFHENLTHWYEQGMEWITNGPSTNQYVNKELWDFVWILERIGKLPYKIGDEYVTLPRIISEKQTETLPNFMEIMNIVEDIQWYRPDIAQEYLKYGFLHWYDETTGRLRNNNSNQHSSLSHPPIWSFILLELSKFSGNKQIIQELYPKLKKNLKWWETYRFNTDFQLFGTTLNVSDFGLETGMLGSPRFNYQFDKKTKKWGEKSSSEDRSLLLVDLNSQMCDYYQNMGVLGMLIGDSSSSDYFEKAQNLQEYAQEVLWDNSSKFYYDYDLETYELQPLKSIDGFWPLFGGLAMKSNIPALMHHLVDPQEFWSEIPIPSLSMDEPFFSNEIWHGPISLSQNLWIITGLKRYNLNQFASKLTYKIFKYLNNSFDLYGGVHQYYPAMSFNVNSIMYKGQKFSDHSPYAFEHAPLHALFYHGLLGVEVLDESINFVPDWGTLDKEINFSVYYRDQKHDAYLSKVGKKYLEITP